MDISSTQNSKEAQITSPLKYTRNITWLQISAILGILLSTLYFFIARECNIWEHTCSPLEESFHLRIVIAQSIYFLITSSLFLVSSFLFKKQKKTSAYLFIIGVIMIVVSILIPNNLFLAEYNSNGGISLFRVAISSAVLIIISNMGILITIGTLFFYIGIIINIYSFDKWVEALSLPKYFKKLYIYVFFLILICLAVNIASKSLLLVGGRQTYNKQSSPSSVLADTYIKANTFFSNEVVIEEYKTDFYGDGKFMLTINYKDVPFSTYFLMSEGYINRPESKKYLESILNKKVSVLVPPPFEFQSSFSESKKYDKPIFYAKIEIDGYDVELSLLNGEATKISNKMKDVNISATSNLDNLYNLEYMTDSNGYLSPFVDYYKKYTEKRYMEICDFIKNPIDPVEVKYGNYGAPSMADDMLYVVFPEEPKTHFVFSTLSSVLQNNNGKKPSQAEIDSVLNWLNQYFKSNKLKMKLTSCSSDTPPEGLSINFRHRSVYGETAYGQSKYPTIETFTTNLSSVDEYNNEDKTISGSGISTLYYQYLNK